MLIVIRTGKDRREHRKLKFRLRELEEEVRDLRVYLDNHEHGEYQLSRSAATVSDLIELDTRIGNVDAWKADRNHSHPEKA